MYELNKEYQKLRQDEINFALLGNFNYSEKKRLEKELFLSKIELILIQGKMICSKAESTIDENLLATYCKLLDYYGLNYAVKKEMLQLRLKYILLKLKSCKALFNSKLVVALKKDMVVTKNELESITLKLICTH